MGRSPQFFWVFFLFFRGATARLVCTAVDGSVPGSGCGFRPGRSPRRAQWGSSAGLCAAAAWGSFCPSVARLVRKPKEERTIGVLGELEKRRLSLSFMNLFARDTHLFFEKGSTFAGFSHHHVVRLLVLSHCCFLRAPVLGLVGLSSSIAFVGVTQFQSGRCNVFGLGFRV